MDLKDSLSNQEQSEQPTAEKILDQLISQEVVTEEKIQLDPTFLKEVESCENIELRIEKVFQFLESSLSATPPKFKDFWEGRKLLLPLFKIIPTQPIRNALWERLSLITQEARRKKEELLKESAFAEEQIEMAISSIEKESTSQSSPMTKEELFGPGVYLLNKSQPFYLDQQNLLNQLNTAASRINALRKELIKTNIRIRSKNQFFERLSLLGNQIFPKRKELIASLSEKFIQDVNDYCKEIKQGLQPNLPLSSIREEIKALQRLAKALTLNTFAFNETRNSLSSLWDEVKEIEKERKKEITQMKEESNIQRDSLLAELEEIKNGLQNGELNNRSAEEKLSSLLSKTKKIRMDRGHLKDLKEKILEVKDPVDKALADAATAFNQKEREKEEKRKNDVLLLLNKMEQLQSPSLDIAAVEEELKAIKQLRTELNCTSVEKREIEQALKAIQNSLAEKRENALLNLPTHEKEYLDNLKTVLKQRNDRKKEVKERLELLRKSKASAGLDFEKALQIDAQEQEERATLEKINEGLQEIEAKIAQFKR